MINLSGPSLVAVATGVIGSAWASGCIANFSLMGVPAARSIPETTARSWQQLYHMGHAVMPKVAIAVALSYAYAAYDTHKSGSGWQGFAAAAATVVSIVPFTLLSMTSTNDKLHQAANGEKVYSAEEMSGLLNKWIVLNLVRSSFPLTGALLGAWTFYNNIIL